MKSEPKCANAENKNKDRSDLKWLLSAVSVVVTAAFVALLHEGL